MMFNHEFADGHRNLNEYQPMVSELGIYIKARLKFLRKTQMWLAEEMGVSNNAVTKWVKSGKISRENFFVLVAKLGSAGAPYLPEVIGHEKEDDTTSAAEIPGVVPLVAKPQRDIDIEEIVRIASSIDATGLGMLLMAAREIAKERPASKTASS